MSKSWKHDNFNFIIYLTCAIVTLYEFNMMNRDRQAATVWGGVHIGDRHDDHHDILLYQVDGFYVEVYYDRTENIIVTFRSFSNITQLEPYLEKIAIGDLIK